MAAPAVAATAPTAIESKAIVAADLSTEYRDFLVPSSTLASSVNHTLPGYPSGSALFFFFGLSGEWTWPTLSLIVWPDWIYASLSMGRQRVTRDRHTPFSKCKAVTCFKHTLSG